MFPAVANRLLFVVVAITVIGVAVHKLVLIDAAVETAPATVAVIIVLGTVVAIRDSDHDLVFDIGARNASPGQLVFLVAAGMFVATP